MTKRRIHGPYPMSGTWQQDPDQCPVVPATCQNNTQPCRSLSLSLPLSISLSVVLIATDIWNHVGWGGGARAT